MTTQNHSSSFTLTRADKVECRPPHRLLPGLLEGNSLACLHGDSGTGKSFLAIDWACRIATGTPWHGLPITQAPVMYVVGRGHRGFRARLDAWTRINHATIGKSLLLGKAFDATDPADRDAFVVAMQKLPNPPGLIILDDLTSMYGRGDENNTSDMNRFIDACQEIQGRLSCAVLLVHHTGEHGRPRGAPVLRDALDAEYRLDEHDDGLRLTPLKMRHAPMPPPMEANLVSVPIGLHEGEPMQSCAIQY